MKGSKLSKADIEYLAKLANLILNDKEVEKYPNQLSQSLKYIENLIDINTSEVPETFFTTKSKNVMDEDEIDRKVVLSQKDVLKNATVTKKGYFVVKRIL